MTTKLSSQLRYAVCISRFSLIGDVPLIETPSGQCASIVNMHTYLTSTCTSMQLAGMNLEKLFPWPKRRQADVQIWGYWTRIEALKV